jgi:FtsP/CotA-like multicopper oxidase with cupredoxin domain
MALNRREFCTWAGIALTAATGSVAAVSGCSRPSSAGPPSGKADYTLRIGSGKVELAPERIVSTLTYNGQFPGPLLRFKEGRRTWVDVFNDTDSPEQLHWHGQHLEADVDGAAEEGTPDIPAHGMRRISFVPGPAGFRFYHTHVVPRADLFRGQYTGLVGPVYIEPARSAGAYDQEVFLTLKEFEPTLSRGGDMATDFLAGDQDQDLKERGESSMAASLGRGEPPGNEVNYGAFAINGRMLGHGDPIRVQAGQRMLLHVLNGSATETRSLAMPGHTFDIVALDGNPVPTRAAVPVLWLGAGERISAIVNLTNPGVWVLGDLSDDDRGNGMGIVVEYAGASGKPQWHAPPQARWDYRRFADPKRHTATPDRTIEMTFAKDNAADHGFNRWTINGAAYDARAMPVTWTLERGRRYRLRMHNATDDIHPIHLHRNTFELTHYAGRATAGVMKDVALLGGYQSMDVDFTADQPGLALFHCHAQLHMDYGFMALFNVT